MALKSRIKKIENYMDPRQGVHVLQVGYGEDNDKAVAAYRKNHPDAKENDLYILVISFTKKGMENELFESEK